MWERATLGALCERGGGIQTGPFGSQLHASDYVVDGVPCVMPTNIGDNRIDESDIARVSDDDVERLSRYRLAVGDIVYSRRGDVEKRALVRAANDGWLCGTGCLRVRVGEGVDSRFVAYALGTVAARKWIVRHAVGATMLNLNTSILARVPLSVPTLPEQRAIAEVLGAIDDKIAANEWVAAQAMSLAGALFAQRQLSASGRQVTLGELIETGALHLGDGYRTKRPEHGTPGLRILRAGDIDGGRVAAKGSEFVSRDFLNRIGAKASRPGDVLMTTKGSVGRVGVVPRAMEQVVYSPQVCFFRVADSDLLDGGYLAGWFRSDDLQRQAAVRMFKSDMAPYINLQDIRSLEFPLESMAEQRSLGAQQTALQGVFEAAHAESEALARTRDALLPLLMSARLRVNDVDQEIAEAL